MTDFYFILLHLVIDRILLKLKKIHIFFCFTKAVKVQRKKYCEAGHYLFCIPCIKLMVEEFALHLQNIYIRKIGSTHKYLYLDNQMLHTLRYLRMKEANQAF